MDLIDAARNGNIELVRLCLAVGEYVNFRDENGTTALYNATLVGYIEIVRLLLDNGADPNIRDRGGDTPLTIAVSHGDTEMVQLLLNKGADPNIRDNDGDTALGLALTRGYTDIVKLLEPHVRSTKIQSRFRGRQTRRKARTQKASQQLQASRLPVDYELSRRIGERLSRMPYNPEVAARIKDEERQDKEIADYLKTLAQYGGKKKRRKTKKKRKKSKKKK